MTKKTQIIFDHQMVMMAKCMQAWNSCKVKATWLYCMFPVEALPYIILREHLSMKMFYQLIEKFFKIKYFSQLAVWVIIEFAFFFLPAMSLQTPRKLTERIFSTPSAS